MVTAPGPRVDRLLVGVDGSTNSLEAVTWAATLARATGAEVVALHALGLLAHLEEGAAPEPVERNQEEIARRLDTEWCAPLRRASVAFRTMMRYGPPARVVLEEAEGLDVDLVVVGSRGHSERVNLLGSTSAHVANHCSKPVLVVPLPRGI